jgi:hypothetical protein
MNIFTYTIGKFSVLTCFKILVILALFFLNLYLYFSESNEYAIKECGPNDRVKKILGVLSAIASIYGGYAGYKGITYNELEKVKMEALYNKAKLEDAQKIIDLSAKYVKGEIQHINEKEFRDNLLIFTAKLKTLALKKNTSIEDQIETNKKIEYLSSTFCSDSKSFVEEHPEYKEIMEVFKKDREPTLKKEISSNIDEDSNKSFMFSGLMENYENLDFLGKIALGLLLLKYTLVSSIISIIFIFYGDFLIKKYKIEVNYPKLAKIISLRRKFQKYYLIMDSLIIVSVILIEIIFCIAVLFF